MFVEPGGENLAIFKFVPKQSLISRGNVLFYNKNFIAKPAGALLIMLF